MMTRFVKLMLITFSLLLQTIIGYVLPSLAARTAVMKVSIRRSYYGKNDFGNWRQRKMKISAKTKTTPGENSEAISSPPFVWFVLLDGSTGEPFIGTNTDKVFVAPTADISDFREAVKTKYDLPAYLKDVAASSLQVFKNKAAFDDKKAEAMKSSASLQGYGLTKEEAVIVAVPSIAISKLTPTLAGYNYNIKIFHRQFLKCLKIAESLNMDAQDEIIKTPSELFGTYLSNGIFIREEYQQLLDIIKGIRELGDDKRCLIIGSPGIGKSAFGILMFILAIKERKNVAYKPKGGGVIYYFTWNNREYITTVWAEEGKMYEGYLDGDETCNYFGLDCFYFTFLFASPCQNNYNEFKKDSCSRIYMNPWSKEECKKYAQLRNLGDEYKRRFNFVGGNPRFLFSPCGSKYEALFADVENAMPDDIKDLKSCIQQVKGDYLIHKGKHILFFHTRCEDAVGISAITYSSWVVESMMMAKFKIKNVNDLRNFLKTSNMSNRHG